MPFSSLLTQGCKVMSTWQVKVKEDRYACVKEDNKVLNKEPFVQRQGKRNSFKFGLHMSHRGWMRINLARALFFVHVSQSCVFSHYLIGIPTTHPLCILAHFSLSSALLTFSVGDTPIRKPREAHHKKYTASWKFKLYTLQRVNTRPVHRCDRRSRLETWGQYRFQLTSGFACL